MRRVDSFVPRKMLEQAAESPPSTAPMMMASNQFIRKDEDLRPENALLACVLIAHEPIYNEHEHILPKI